MGAGEFGHCPDSCLTNILTAPPLPPTVSSRPASARTPTTAIHPSTSRIPALDRLEVEPGNSSGFSSWTAWSSCSRPCGGGTQQRRRAGTNIAQTQGCNIQSCQASPGSAGQTGFRPPARPGSPVQANTRPTKQAGSRPTRPAGSRPASQAVSRPTSQAGSRLEVRPAACPPAPPGRAWLYCPPPPPPACSPGHLHGFQPPAHCRPPLRRPHRPKRPLRPPFV